MFLIKMNDCSSTFKEEINLVDEMCIYLHTSQLDDSCYVAKLP